MAAHAVEHVVGEAVVIHRIFEPRVARVRVLTEISPASTVAFLRELLDLDPSASLVQEVWFQHAGPRDPSAHEDFFGGPVRFSAPETRLVLAGDVLARPVTKRNAGLHAYLERSGETEAIVGDRRVELTDV